MTTKRVALGFVFALWASPLAACGSDDESGRSPSQQCDDMVDTYCAKAAECSVTTDRTEQGDDCEFAVHIQLACDEALAARSVSDCLRAIDAIDCRNVTGPDSPPFPDACNGILELPPASTR